MAEENNYINGSIEYQLKYYQMMRELETFREKGRKEQEEKAKQDSQNSSTGPVEDKEGQK